MSIDTDVTQLVINELTKAQYEGIETPNINELYVVTDDNTYVQVDDLATVATSGSYDDLINKPTIPTETTVSNWGFTKNNGTVTSVNNISPDANGNVTLSIPSEVTETTVSGWGFTKNNGTITGIKMNGSSVGTSGVVDLGTVITDVSGKANDNAVVHTTADETIDGNKTFKQAIKRNASTIDVTTTTGEKEESVLIINDKNYKQVGVLNGTRTNTSNTFRLRVLDSNIATVSGVTSPWADIRASLSDNKEASVSFEVGVGMTNKSVNNTSTSTTDTTLASIGLMNSRLSNKQDALPSGTSGHVLTKTDDGVEWKENLCDTAESVKNQNTADLALPKIKTWEGLAQDWKNYSPTTCHKWTIDGTLSGTSSSTIPVNANFTSGIAYGNNIYMSAPTDANGSTIGVRSADGDTWEQITLPESGYWVKMKFLNGKFYLLSMGTTAKPWAKLLITEDGKSWTSVRLPDTYWVDIAYGNNTYVIVANTSPTIGDVHCMYSYDGLNWNPTTLPVETRATRQTVDFINGRFITGGQYTTNNEISTDGINWTLSSARYSHIHYFNNQYYGIEILSNKLYTSPDFETWTEVSGVTGSDLCINDRIMMLKSTDKFYYSINGGSSWSNVSEPLMLNGPMTYCENGSFICSPGSTTSNKILKVDFLTESVYTYDETPTSSSSLEDKPGKASAKTITSIGTNQLTLSDAKVYYKNADENGFVYQSIGDLHPDWLCYIKDDFDSVDSKIDDNSTSLTTTWSSTKISNILSATALIEDNTINTTRTWSSYKINSVLGDIATILDNINGEIV